MATGRKLPCSMQMHPRRVTDPRRCSTGYGFRHRISERYQPTLSRQPTTTPLQRSLAAMSIKAGSVLAATRASTGISSAGLRKRSRWCERLRRCEATSTRGSCGCEAISRRRLRSTRGRIPHSGRPSIDGRSFSSGSRGGHAPMRAGFRVSCKPPRAYMYTRLVRTLLVITRTRACMPTHLGSSCAWICTRAPRFRTLPCPHRVPCGSRLVCSGAATLRQSLLFSWLQLPALSAPGAQPAVLLWGGVVGLGGT